MRLRFFTTVLFLGALAGNAWADAYTVLGFNAESMALGGAMTGGPVGSSGVFYNPAGLNRTHKQSSDASYVWMRPNLYIDRDADKKLDSYLAKDGIETSDTKSYNVIQFQRGINDVQERRAERVPLIRGFNLGLVVPLAEHREESVASFGMGLYVPQGPIMRQRINAPSTPYFVEYDDRSQRIVINPALGFSITDKIHIGGGASLLVDIPVDVDVFVPINFNVVDLVAGKADDLNVSVTPLAQANITPVFAPTAGVLIDVLDNLSFGASYRDEVKAKIEAKANILAETGSGRTTAMPMTLKSSAAFTPRQVSLGGRYQPIEKLTIYGDATWSQWSHYRPPVAEFSVANIRQLVDEIIAGSGIEDLDLFGNSINFAGTDFEIPTKEEILELVPDYVRVKYEFKGFRNTWTPRLGAAYEINDELTAMGGYFYRPSVEDPMGFRVTQIVDFGGTVTRTRINQNTLDNDHHGFTGGLSYKYRNYKFTATGVYVQLVEKTVDKAGNFDINYNDESTQTGLQTTAFGYPGYKYGGRVYGGMAQAAISF
jgi:long-subunit fatty acid transport protein